jgi:hypothetical protein
MLTVLYWDWFRKLFLQIGYYFTVFLITYRSVYSHLGNGMWNITFFIYSPTAIMVSDPATLLFADNHSMDWLISVRNGNILLLKWRWFINFVRWNCVTFRADNKRQVSLWFVGLYRVFNVVFQSKFSSIELMIHLFIPEL